jgi:hypothetical protein
MTDLEQEAAWRTEFEADGERAVLDTICHGRGIYPEPRHLPDATTGLVPLTDLHRYADPIVHDIGIGAPSGSSQKRVADWCTSTLIPPAQ